MKKYPLLSCVCLLLGMSMMSGKVSAENQSREKKAIKQWRDLKFGLFIHWGLYSIPGGVWDGKNVTLGYSEQIQAHGKIAQKDYVALTKQFKAEGYRAGEIAKLAKQAGMKYIVFTAKHHDGFSLFDTQGSEYNVVDATPYGKDVLKQLQGACQKEGLGLGVYFSLIDWHFPGALPMSSHNSDKIPAAHEKFNLQQIKELMTNYGPIVEVWFDMSNPTVDQSKKFAAMVHKHQPGALVNGRVWNNRGDFLVMSDNQVPKFKMMEPWQTPASIYKATWGYRSWQKRENLRGKTIQHIKNLVNVVGRGGNYLLNIGPRGDGSLVPFEVKILQGIGRWMAINHEAIYGTSLNPFDAELAFGQVTMKKQKMYVHVMDRPSDGKIILPGFKNKIKKVYRLDDSEKKALRIRQTENSFIVELGLGVKKDPILDCVQVIVIEFEGELNIEKTNFIEPSKAGRFEISGKQAVDFFSRSGGDYYSTKRMTVKKQWTIKVKRAGSYRIKIEGQSKKKHEQYILQIAGRAVSFSLDDPNASEFIKDALDGLEFKAGHVYDLKMTLAHPKNKSQDMGVKSMTIVLEKK